MSRRLFVLVAIAILILGFGIRPRPATAQNPVALSNTERATAAYAAMLRAFAVPGTPHLGEASPRGLAKPYAYQWPLSQAISATLGMAGLPLIGGDYLPDLRDRVWALAYYWDESDQPPAFSSYVVPPYDEGGDVYYDDNAWTGLQLVQYYRHTREPASLIAARAIFNFLVSGWDTDPTHVAPGGIFWVRAGWSDDRNTVSTAPAALLGYHLYELTRDPFFLDWATRMYDWLNTYLRAPSGLYWDRITPDGRIERTHFSYNQGAMIGANVLRYRITGDSAYLREAERIAEASLRLFGNREFGWQDPALNAIFFKYLLLLESANNRTQYREVMQAYADQLWTTTVDPTTFLVEQDPGGGVRLLAQSVIVQLHAYLDWDRRDLRNLG